MHFRSLFGSLPSLVLLVLAPWQSAYASMIDGNTPAGIMPVSGGTDWTLEFSDEFNGTTLDTSKWGIDLNSRSRGPRWERGIADWWWVENNVSLNGSGNLVLDVTKHNSNTMYCGSVSSDEVTVSLFVTDDDTISGTRTNLVTHFSGTSNSGTYVSVSQPAVHTATATHAGKVLFAVIETTSGGFARIDNFELIANPPSRFETWIDGFMFRNQGLTIGTISSNN